MQCSTSSGIIFERRSIGGLHSLGGSLIGIRIWFLRRNITECIDRRQCYYDRNAVVNEIIIAALGKCDFVFYARPRSCGIDGGVMHDVGDIVYVDIKDVINI